MGEKRTNPEGSFRGALDCFERRSFDPPPLLPSGHLRELHHQVAGFPQQQPVGSLGFIFRVMSDNFQHDRDSRPPDELCPKQTSFVMRNKMNVYFVVNKCCQFFFLSVRKIWPTTVRLICAIIASKMWIIYYLLT